MATLDLKPTLSGDGVSISLTIRLLMQGKEVGSIIGKKGEIVKRFREESGAKINISDGSCPERIVTITGTTDAIYKAFNLICQKNEEAMGYQSGSGVPRPPITLRLVVPASQCGSLIGKGGAKIKEIREISGASIQVASEMLPNSTERAVTVSGTCDAVTQCVYLICGVMVESPPKGATVPYRPKPQLAPANPMMYGGGQGFGMPGGFGMPHCPDMNGGAGMALMAQGPSNPGHGSPPVISPHTPMQMSSHLLDTKSGQILLPGLPPVMPDMTKGHPLTSLLGGMGGMTGHHNPLQANTAAMSALAALAGAQMRNPPMMMGGTQSQEITVPNELIGCIIGKGGTKIAEIRQLTGAMITISKFDDTTEDATHQDRVITIKGSPDQIALAQYLINTRQISGATIRISNCEEKERESGHTDRVISISGAAENVALAVYLINLRISLETASMGVAGMGFQYISPNHIVKVPIH